jgi:Transposase, Mutator family
MTKPRSTSPLERLNREIARRSDVAGIYSNDESLIRPAGTLLLQRNNEWRVGPHHLPREPLGTRHEVVEAEPPGLPPQATAVTPRQVVLVTA